MPGSRCVADCEDPRGLTQAQFQRQYLYSPPPPQGVADRLCRACQPSTDCASRCVRRRLPILAWLPAYRLQDDLVGDLIAGVTVAIMHIPQGMAYALLAGIPPIHGLYMAFFQCLLYAVLGTSRHLSVGTFAVTCIMTGKVVTEHSVATLPDTAGRPVYDPVTVATTVTLAVGLIQLVLFSVQMSALSVLLSDMLVQGFTTGAAVHVLLSQVPSLLGLSPPRFAGAGQLLKLSFAIVKTLAVVNPASIIISTTTIVILVFNNELVKPKVAKRTRVPVPIELLVVIVGTLASFLGDLSGRYDLQVIGNVTTGLPRPSSPALPLLPRVLPDAAVIGVVTYSAALSMAQLLAHKHEYTVDASQELLAQGVGNVVSAWFSCAPMAASLSRSLIVDGTGGRTQASGIITSLLLLTVLLWLGPLFTLLPKCVLSAIIVVSLKGLLVQLSALPALWRTSRADALIWTGTLLTVVCVDIGAGLAAGVLLSLAVLLWRHQRPTAELLGRLPDTDRYVELGRYQAAEPEPDVHIFRFGGALHFCNAGYFRRRLAALTGLQAARRRAAGSHVTPQRRWRRAAATSSKPDTELLIPLTTEDSDNDDVCSTETRQPRKTTQDMADLTDEKAVKSDIHLKFSHLVLDMSCVSFTDTASTRALLAAIKEYQQLGVCCCLAGCNEAVLGMLHACRSPPQEDQLYPSVQDAILAIRSAHAGCADQSE